MPITSAYLMPHGMQILPDLDENAPESFQLLYRSMLSASFKFHEDPSDLIIILTPHGLATDKDFGIYMNETHRGYLPRLTFSNVDGDEILETLVIPNDLEISQKLKEFFQRNQFPLTGLTLASPSFSSPLAWGEIVPLYFFNSKNNQVPAIVISLPKLRNNYPQFKPTLERFGILLGEYCQNLKQRITLIISGDLSHMHQSDSSFGYDPSSEVFDSKINQWIETLDPELFESLDSLNETAKSCGINTLAIFKGIIDYDRGIGAQNWKGKVIHYGVPTYFGMTVAEFLPFKQ